MMHLSLDQLRKVIYRKKSIAERGVTESGRNVTDPAEIQSARDDLLALKAAQNAREAAAREEEERSRR